MEYNNTYLDDEEMPHLEQEQPQNGVDQPHYIHEDAAVNTLGSGESRHPVVDEEELLAAQAAADAAVAQQQQHGNPGGVFSNVGQGLVGKNRDMIMQYWQETINSIEHDDHDFKNHQLPLARIKKVMKTDEDVRMISAEAPILFAKGCEVFITELTMRAWIHAEENKRRTLQKSDIAAALTKSDMFDFLIDVVPREEEKPKKSYPSRSNSYINTPSNPSAHSLLPPYMLPPHLRGVPMSDGLASRQVPHVGSMPQVGQLPRPMPQSAPDHHLGGPTGLPPSRGTTPQPLHQHQFAPHTHQQSALQEPVDSDLSQKPPPHPPHQAPPSPGGQPELLSHQEQLHSPETNGLSRQNSQSASLHGRSPESAQAQSQYNEMHPVKSDQKLADEATSQLDKNMGGQPKEDGAYFENYAEYENTY